MRELIDVATVVIPMSLALYYFFKQAAEDSANHANPAGEDSSLSSRPPVFYPADLGPLDVIEIEDALEESRRTR